MRVVLLGVVASLLVGCATVFDSETLAISDLEAVAYAGREYDRPDREVRYQFTDTPDVDCRRLGAVARAVDTVNACAQIDRDPCVVVLPYGASRRLVRHEELHCRYGNWHRKAG